MAVARTQGQGGFTAIHVWLIVFVALWLTSTVLLVILYLDQEKKTTAVDDIREEIGKVISSTGRQDPLWTQAKSGSGNTMVDLLMKERGDTAELLSGNPDSRIESLQSDFDATISAIQEDPFIQDSGTQFAATNYADALNEMFGLFRTAAEARSEATQGLDNLTAELERVRGAQTGQKSEFVEQGDSLRAEVQKLREEYDKAMEQHAQQVSGFEEEREQIQRQCSDDIQAQRNRTADLRSDYDELFARFEQLKAKLGQSQVSPLPLGTARGGDGLIVTAKPGDDVVYIDLGREDHLTLGLEFAVYDVLTGIPEEGLAKARISVVSIGEKTAACEIVARNSNEFIGPGDIIANPVYDRNRTLKFFVMGDFDLNGDGRSDPDGMERISSIIEKWGGEVEPRLNAQVDFVVLGGPPSTPRRSANLDESEDRNYQAQMKAYERYQSELNTVNALAVPRLTQSVFLNFLGLSSESGVIAESLSAAP